MNTMKRVIAAIGLGVVLGVLGLLLWRPGQTAASHAGQSDLARSPAVTSDEDPPSAPTPRAGARRPFKALPANLISGAPSLVTNQNDPSYDAYRLIKVLDISVATAFDSEKRDPTWAPQREKAITATIERDLQNVKANSRLVKTECHHSTCEMLFEGPTLEDARWGSLLIQYAPLGAITEPGQPVERDGKVYLPVFVALQPQERANEGWEQIYQMERKAQLAIRRQGGPPVPGLPPYPED
jgi:hypothetical protein